MLSPCAPPAFVAGLALGVSALLRKSLRSTNIIENCFSLPQQGCMNVKRRRDAAMAWRWAGTMLLDAEGRFHRIRGHRDLGPLLDALGRSPTEPAAAEAKKALDARKEVA